MEHHHFRDDCVGDGQKKILKH